MATYIYGAQQQTFGSRDALPPGNAEKVVKGSQLDAEFVALQAYSQEANNEFLAKNAQPGDFVGTIDGGIVQGGTY